ncbi:RNAse H domain protein, YqgF family [Bacteriovorax sp. BSW11_IV]|uniref:Holliday junction resolvase RuvX n=1 Tax=Bacteriovorax sp. BSW11_IV TaxID=1353529 RepID=UPI00038A3AFD|nr:Holliday junction resolvase RuvX [Bacteriovorax sp. BSW11_IV]EQC50177.1 RNAse H domain protein, YqgF family [Bacteriovorax sp. BSW11_IV]
MNFENFPNYTKFLNKTILAVDYGTKVTGLGIFTPGRDPYPMPFGKIIYKSDDQIICDIKSIIDDELVEVIVLGLPLYTDGNESDMTEKVKKFSEEFLKTLDGVELYLQDETLTSYEAAERMKNSPRYNFKVDMREIDALAASIILEDFIKNEIA